MMYLAKFLPGSREPIVSEVDDGEGFITVTGAVGVKQRECKSWELPNGGAASLQLTRGAAITAAKCVMIGIQMRREAKTRRDRA